MSANFGDGSFGLENNDNSQRDDARPERKHTLLVA